MANQLKMAIVQAILSLHAQGWSQRAIAKRLEVHRETVSRHVRRAAGGPKPATLPAGPGTGVRRPARPAIQNRPLFFQRALGTPGISRRLRARGTATVGGIRSKRSAPSVSPPSGSTKTSWPSTASPAATRRCSATCVGWKRLSRCRFGGWNAARARRRRSTSASERRS